MKKKVSLFLLFIICISFIIAPHLYAANSNGSSMVLIVGDNKPDTDFSYENVDIKQMEKMELDQLLSYQSIVINYNEFKKVDNNLYNTLLDNGSIIMVYGKSLPIEKIQSYLGDIKIKKNELPLADPIESGYPKDSKEKLSNGLIDKVMLIYAYKLNDEINYGLSIDCSNEKLLNNETNKWIKAKDIEAFDKDGNRINNGKELTINNVLKDIDIYLDDIKNNGKKVIDTQTDENDGQVSPLMYPLKSSTMIKADYWSYFSSYGKVKAVVYATRVRSGSTSYWDLATSMTADADGAFYVRQFKTKTHVNYTHEDVVDWTYLPSNTGSCSISLTYGAPNVSYSTSTSNFTMYNNVLTKQVQWRAYVRNPYVGNAYKIEPAIRASNTYGDMWFRRYYQADFNFSNYTAYSTPYYYRQYDLGMK